MKLYLTHSQIPEIASLSAEHRKTAYARYIQPLLVRGPVRLVKVAFILLFFSAMAFFEFHSSVESAISWIIGYLAADYLFDIAVIALHRSELRDSIRASGK